jgi:hypothetical protein
MNEEFDYICVSNSNLSSMKKLYLLLIVVFLAAKPIFAQILTASHPVTYYSGPDNLKLTSNFTLNNNGSQALNVMAEMYSRTMSPGHYSYFCWTICYDTSIVLSTAPIVLNAGESTSVFEGWAGGNNTPGQDEITYRFYDMNGMSDTLYLTFTYDFYSATGINEITSSKSFLNFSGPNPANNFTSISYNIPQQKEAKIVVTNLLGKKVNEFFLNGKSSSLQISLADIVSGIYLYSLVVDGKIVSTKKLIVAHQ